MYRNILKGYAIYGVGLKEGKGRARDITMQGEVIAHTGPASARSYLICPNPATTLLSVAFSGMNDCRLGAVATTSASGRF